ncbi:serine/threonine-protein kinase LMTK2-like [Hippoglossus hippoglossus]|uniref:serine/threonine-protein kinase LMTK2-like n=1 Tax=Hippoglossus hippoglossus TaxID=8267 RepID=UPI00148DBD86|nr:serine/threonine-protein kinase LMTK2-like [Hippoglossus hippoglossus]XP_034425734.1 serine/threonine-protein kinase LMTK2-like [Hippoglossus hippoglossus]
MSGAHRVQELEPSRGGVALVVSLDGVNWLHRKRCRDKGRTKRNKDLQFWISSGQVALVDEKRQPTTCIPDQRGTAALDLWRNIERRSRPWSSSFPLSPQRCCLLEEPLQHSALTSSVSECPKEASWKTLILNIRDIFTSITRNVNLTTQPHVLTMNNPNRLIIFCDEDIPLQLYNDISSTQDCRTIIGTTGCSDNKNVSSHLKNAHLPSDLNNNSEEDHSEVFHGENLNIRTRKSLLKSYQNYKRPGESSERDRKLRRSVSFDDDVTVFLFDQEGPTMELHPEPCTSLPNTSTFNLPDVTLDDCGLEWEDDFSALEWSWHLQRVSRSLHSTLSLSTPSWTAASRPERYLPSQTCLFLTHVAESDLEL